jgi:hypothetical protein
VFAFLEQHHLLFAEVFFPEQNQNRHKRSQLSCKLETGLAFLLARALQLELEKEQH